MNTLPSFDYIEKNTVWVAKFEHGHRITGTYDEISKYKDCEDLDEIDTVSWKGQPDSLKQFYKDYEYAFYQMGRTDLYFTKDFYNEWVKDPSKFEPQKQPVIGKLSEEIKSLGECGNLIIQNYDFETAGNHHTGNFVEALTELEVDFDIISVSKRDADTTVIIIQTDDQSLFNKFGMLANEKAIKHDRFIGDGKYWEEEREF